MTTTDRTITKQIEQGELASQGLARPKKAVGEKNEETFIFDLDADAAQAERGITCRKPFKVKGIDLTPSSALAAHAANYNTYDVQKRPSAALGAPVSVGTTNTNTAGANVSLVAWTKVSIPLSATVANRKFAIGDVLTVKSTETGTPASPLGTIAITVEYI